MTFSYLNKFTTMRKVLLSTFILLFSSALLLAQYQKPAMSDAVNMSAPMNKVYSTGFETIDHASIPPHDGSSVFSRTDTEVFIGQTVYDLQTNAAMQNRIVRNEETGELAGVWTFGSASPAFAERGTGYNSTTNGAWGDLPDARIESVRTGWPSISILEDGSHHILAHSADNDLITNRQVNGEWVESMIPSGVATGSLWPRSVAAGNTVHAIAITAPEAFDGVIYEGVDGHLLYHRSLDGGATWDMVDVILPGIDSSRFINMNLDSYAIDADGDNVAIVLFSDFGDIMIAKSEDNGSTWNSTIIHDFPFDKYVANSLYDTLLLDPQETADGPNGTAVQTSDGTGDVVIDEAGMAHVFYGEMYVQDIDPNDAGTTFFPLWNNVRYWNENHGPDSTRVVAGLIDGADGDGMFTFPAGTDNVGTYGTSLTSFITAGVDEENNVFIAYSALTEDFINTVANPVSQNNRHILTTASVDGGETWVEPIDLIREDVVLEVDILPFMEAVYPSMSRNVGDSRVHLIYQQDFEPGTAVAGVNNGEGDSFGPNFINYIGVTLDEYGITTETEVVEADLFSFALAPNPATDMVKVSYELPTAAKVTMTIMNMMGQVVRVIENGSHSAGEFSAPVRIDDLMSGVYLVSFQANDQIAVQKLVVK